MKYLCLAGLILLPGLLSPGTDFRPGQQWFDAEPQVATESDPERLFVEAVERYQTGDDTGVKVRIDEACRLWLKQGEREQAARARMQIADLYRDDRRFASSLEHYQQAGKTSGISLALTALISDSIGQVYAQIYENELSFKYYSNALDLAHSANALTVEVQVQLDLATLHGKTGSLPKGIGLAKNAVETSTKAGDERLLALAKLVLGQLEFKSGLLSEGKVDLEQALALFQRQDDWPNQVRTLCALSGLNLSANEVALALGQAETAFNLANGHMRQDRTAGQKSLATGLFWPSALAKARALRKSRRLEEAKKAYNYANAAAAASFLITYRMTDQSAIGFSEDWQVVYRELVDVLMTLGEPEEAYNAYQARIKTLAGSILAGRARRAQGGRVVNERQVHLNQVMVALHSQLVSPRLTGAEREQIERELDDAEREATEMRLQDEMTPAGSQTSYSAPAEVSQLQQRLSAGDQAILEFDLGEERSFVWLITAQSLDVEILPARKDIELKVRQYLDDLSKAPANFLLLRSALTKQRAQGAEIFKLLLGKLASKLTPDSSLLVIPDGLLNYLPFDTLVNGDRFLIEDNQISYLPSASVIEVLRQGSANSNVPDADQPKLLAFGDPSFSSKGNSTNNPAVRLLANEREYWSANASSLTPLPRTRDEVEYIAGLLPKERARTYLGQDCTEGAFKHEQLSGYKWIHLATHSLIDDLSPDRSAVVLTSTGDRSEDGLLRAGEIKDLHLDCALVVLSACQTARGRVSSGEGVIGLSRSFLIAGARSLVVSQWPVSDISTAQLMKDFYRSLLKGKGTAAALREAKLKMLRGGLETQHPYYWAPFISIAAP